MFRAILARFGELARTIASLFGACDDWAVFTFNWWARLRRRDVRFAFLVHPRTDDLLTQDVYGGNDIYRWYPAFRWLPNLLPEAVGQRLIYWYLRLIPPVTLTRIAVRTERFHMQGLLMTTARTPQMLMQPKGGGKKHLQDLYRHAARRGARHVGLGALLPSMTNYGYQLKKVDLGNVPRPTLSTGHAYTACVIGDFLSEIVAKREYMLSARVAIIGAAGSTGVATLRYLERFWQSGTRLDLLLVDTLKKKEKLAALAKEATACPRFERVETATDMGMLHDRDYVIVVTNAKSTIVEPAHLRPGTVVIDDSQPRNTTPELLAAGCYVVDVLARIEGLDCGFDFGFGKEDPRVTFTCLAETILAGAYFRKRDWAIGEVTDDLIDQVAGLAAWGKTAGLIGELPYYSYGKPMSAEMRRDLLSPRPAPEPVELLPAAE